MNSVRPYRDGDAPALAAVFERAVRGIASRDYAPAQIEAWIGREPREARFRDKMADGRRCWVTVDATDRVTAFADLEPDGHIDFLFADPDVAGQGVTTVLLEVLEQAARASGLSRLYVEASEPAKRFFVKRGYTVVERRDFEIGGVPIHNYAMERLF
ncbi:GNAT family N-acetyltransferase [Brevundimonas sp. Root1423]|uniref:GNAT family N-acetyltransferase n=1 Tax=Brevundimonas sp. Root1423 TaxID=1736462 RepID=UPI000AC81644|nr:GNAT family N-acetyltransferase [Brevundimonas sp. Root1423]